MKEKILFIDRDGTLIKEPPSKQVDNIEQIELVPGVIPALLKLQQSGYKFVMVSNQDGLGSPHYPEENFARVQHFVLNIFRSQGIEFHAIHICPHWQHDNCDCRKPRPGLLFEYFLKEKLFKDKCFVIGDRQTDLDLANNLGIQGILIAQDSEKDWQRAADQILTMPRLAHIVRETKETKIDCFIDLGSSASSEVQTGIAFFDHMLEQLAKHAGCYLRLRAVGDLEVDDHHLVEDCSLVLGKACRKALADKWGIARYGFVLPMDEALATVAIDLSGRACLVFDAKFNRPQIKNLATEMIRHFFSSFSQSLQATLHIKCVGDNTHHMIEAIFKGVGRSLKQAFMEVDTNLPTTKGVL
jgi:imidazoleglycerol-phosphate dehydratase / histidinol-phosphatase